MAASAFFSSLPQQPQPASPGPPAGAPVLTTSDLLRLLAADSHPFAAVAEAVSARFGGGPESQQWLARTLITLLRDGLLYTEAEKLNAAYLLRYAAVGAPGAREALARLSMPDGGEPPAVRSWAAALAQQSMGSLQGSGGGSLGSSPVGSPTWRQGGSLNGPALHQRTPQQVLAEAAAAPPAPPVEPQSPFARLPLGQLGQQGQPQPLGPLPWQGTALSAAAAAPPPPGYDSGPQMMGSPAGSGQLGVPPWLQPQPQSPLQQPLSPHLQPQPMSPHLQPQPMSPHLQPPMSPASPHMQMQQPHSPHQQPLSPLHMPSPLQSMLPQQGMAAAAAAAAAQHAQQQQAAQQQQRDELAGMRMLLRQAAQMPLVPALQQQLMAGLRGPLGPALTAPLAAAVSSSGSGGGGGGGEDADGLQLHRMGGLVENNWQVAYQLIMALLAHHPEAAVVYSAAVAEMPMTPQSVECMSAVVADKGEIPGWVLSTFLSNCMQDTSACVDAGRQTRQIRLLCASVTLTLMHRPQALQETLPELLSFCIQHSRHKEAADLYKNLRDAQAGSL